MKKIIMLSLFLCLPFIIIAQNNLDNFETKFTKSIVKIKYNYKSNLSFIPIYYESSGFAIGDGSLIVTVLGNKNYAEAISIYNSEDSTKVPAWVVAKDTNQNLCILKTEKPFFKPIEFTKQPIRQAQDIVLIGWLSDYLNTNNYIITEGIVSSSAKDTIVQTSAPLNYGMEGGAALDLDGNVMGMVVGKNSRKEYEKTGFLLRKKFILDLVDSLDSETYVLDTNETIYQYHENLGAYKRYAEGVSNIYIDVNPENYESLSKGFDEFISLTKQSLDLEKNPRTYANLAYAHLLKIYTNSISMNWPDTDELTLEYKNNLNLAYSTGDSNYKEYLDRVTKVSEDFFKLDLYSTERFNYKEFKSDYFSRSWQHFVSSYRKKDVRKEDFSDWMRYGLTPKELDDALEVFKIKRGGITAFRRDKFETIGDFWLKGPINFLNMTELISDPYQDYKKVVPVSNYFLVGYTSKGYGIRLGFENYQRRIPFQYINQEEFFEDESIRETYYDQKSLIVGVVMYEYFEAYYFLNSEAAYYGSEFQFNFMYNRPGDANGLTDYYYFLNLGLNTGYDRSEKLEFSSNRNGHVSTFGAGIGINIYRNYYIRSMISISDQENLYKLGFGLEAYY